MEGTRRECEGGGKEGMRVVSKGTLYDGREEWGGRVRKEERKVEGF